MNLNEIKASTASPFAARNLIRGCTGLVILLAALTASALEVTEVVGQETVDMLRGKTILLAGATGNNGSAVLKQFGELGLRPRAMSRDAAKARGEFGDQYEWVEADVTDPASLPKAMEGVDVVIWAVATAMPFGGNRPEKVDYEGVVNVANAAKAAGVKRMVMITSSVSGKEDSMLNWVGNMLIWKGRGEQAVIESGLEYVIVGPTAIKFEPGSQAIRLEPRPEYQRGQTVMIGDLASVVIAAAVLPEAANRVFSVYNDDAPVQAGWQSQFAEMPAN